MKNLTMLCLSILILTTISCNKEERLSKKYTNKLARTWNWNGQRQYSSRVSPKTTFKYYQDTSIAIIAIDDNTVEFMGIKFTLDNTASFGKYANPVLRYIGEGADKYLHFDYTQDTAHCLIVYSQISSIDEIRLSGR